ncbi:MAG TPA: topoisomerase DNA-binding C4 zinc finger domain-containing protein, partial [Candidatus Binatus sp.]|nr:topoisomerase DNA-binding C4 zinc finger domain-containing protein [Candidatus Binatus sp.]
CSLYPEHKETRPLPGDEPPPMEGTGETCPKCGLGTLVAKRGRFGAFVGCNRYPDCDFIRRDGPPPPAQLAFQVSCPKNADGHLVARRARRTGSVFWGCSNYPMCDYTTNLEPLGALHDVDGGPVASGPKGPLCLTCGAPIEVPAAGPPEIGRTYAGGPPDAAAIAPRGRAGGRGARPGGRSGSTARRRPGGPAGRAGAGRGRSTDTRRSGTTTSRRRQRRGE